MKFNSSASDQENGDLKMSQQWDLLESMTSHITEIVESGQRKRSILEAFATKKSHKVSIKALESIPRHMER